MIEFDDEEFLSWQDCPEVPVISLAWLYMMLRCHGVDYAVGDA
jgi:hypothetical protein